MTTVLVLFFDSLAAFAFAKYDFPGKKCFFGVLLVDVHDARRSWRSVPQFVIMAQLGWVGIAQGADHPGRGQRLRHLLDAPVRRRARSPTNCWTPPGSTAPASSGSTGTWRCPCCGPALAFLGIFTFIASWNDYIWPLIVLVNPDRLTLQVALAAAERRYTTDYSMVMAGALMSVDPAGAGVHLLRPRVHRRRDQGSPALTSSPGRP